MVALALPAFRVASLQCTALSALNARDWFGKFAALKLPVTKQDIAEFSLRLAIENIAVNA